MEKVRKMTMAEMLILKRVQSFHGLSSPLNHDGSGVRKEKKNNPKTFFYRQGYNKRFGYKSNIKRHIEDSHGDEGASSSSDSQDYIQSCHQHVLCEVCGTKQLRKNMKRHMCGHENEGSSERIKCSFKDCECTFATKSNLNQHVKVVHLELRPFACQFPGCGQRFAFKHVRDNHEKSVCHVYVHGDFEEADEQLQTRPRGGRKRTCPTVKTLLRKRVVPPSHTDSVLNHAPEYLAWLLSAEGDC
ncbi:hypothetical protein MKX03_035628 [Papaver bracteatum]|nr:hypothetical protein MKX03_035628 [Papaver bracteatum]